MRKSNALILSLIMSLSGMDSAFAFERGDRGGGGHGGGGGGGGRIGGGGNGGGHVGGGGGGGGRSGGFGGGGHVGGGNGGGRSGGFGGGGHIGGGRNGGGNPSGGFGGGRNGGGNPGRIGGNPGRNGGGNPNPGPVISNPNRGPIGNPNRGPIGGNPNRGPIGNPNRGPIGNPNRGPIGNPNRGPIGNPGRIGGQPGRHIPGRGPVLNIPRNPNRPTLGGGVWNRRHAGNSVRVLPRFQRHQNNWNNNWNNWNRNWQFRQRFIQNRRVVRFNHSHWTNYWRVTLAVNLFDDYYFYPPYPVVDDDSYYADYDWDESSAPEAYYMEADVEDYLNIRSTPNANGESNICGQLPSGAVVPVVSSVRPADGSGGNWAMIKVDDDVREYIDNPDCQDNEYVFASMDYLK